MKSFGKVVGGQSKKLHRFVGPAAFKGDRRQELNPGQKLRDFIWHIFWQEFARVENYYLPGSARMDPLGFIGMFPFLWITQSRRLKRIN